MAVNVDETPLRDFVAAWADMREYSEDCTCEDDPDSQCWYHLTEKEQHRERLKSFVDAYNFEYGLGKQDVTEW
jgi:hypothetical protein